VETRKFGEFTLTRASRSHPWDVKDNTGHLCSISPETKGASMHEFEDKKVYRVQAQRPGINVNQVVIGSDLLKYLRAL